MTQASETRAVRKALVGRSPPRTYEELRAVLGSDTLRLPKKLRQVGTFFWQDPGAVALGTITSVSEQAGVMPSAIVRFAQALGFSGFTDIQQLFKDYVRDGWGDGRERSPLPGSEEPAADALLLHGFLDTAQAALQRAGDEVSVTAFGRAADILAGAQCVYLAGSKRAFPVTTYASITLTRLGIRNVLVDNVGAAGFDQLSWAGPADALLAVSFSPYNSITPELAALAAQRDVPVVSITDGILSPLVPLSRVWLEVVEGTFRGFATISASVAVVTALTLAVARRRPS
jgi:DNA-binding MurR/RpiR family transcriptional regulator